VIFPDAREPLNLPLAHPGLRLLQRLRDEAHRFANTYNASLRSKKIRESVLDDFPGLGPKRRAALLTHFGSLEKLKAASVEEIAEAPGIGPKRAGELRGFWRANPRRPHSRILPRITRIDTDKAPIGNPGEEPPDSNHLLALMNTDPEGPDTSMPGWRRSRRFRASG